MGIRRLGIPSDYTPKELEKVKKRKTKNKSKNIRDDIDNISNPLNNDLLFNQEDHTLI